MWSWGGVGCGPDDATDLRAFHLKSQVLLCQVGAVSQYLELEQPCGVLEDDGLDVAADLDRVDRDARDKVEEDVVPIRPVGQRVGKRHLLFNLIILQSVISRDIREQENLEFIKCLQ